MLSRPRPQTKELQTTKDGCEWRHCSSHHQCTVTGHPIPNVSPEKLQLVKNEAMNLKENKEKFTGEFGGRKGKREMMLIYYNLKSKKVIF